MRCHKIAAELKHACYQAIVLAVRRREMQPAKALLCVDCGAKACDYDHRDYTKPLNVEPVCRRCNQLRGPGSIGDFGMAA